MIKEAIEKIQALVTEGLSVKLVTFEGRNYLDRPVEEMQPPLNHTVEVGTLTGFSDAVNLAPKDSSVFIQVVSPTLVQLANVACNAWGKRQIALKCVLPPYGRFAFGEYMDQERFHIGLQSFFDQSPEDMEYLYRVAGNLTAEQVNTSVDNGLSQTAGQRIGVLLADKVAVKRLVTLKPWRTFREIEQPASTFIFRLRNQENAVPLLSLHVGDGEKWQLDAVQAIKEWLRAKQPTLPIVA